MKAHPYVVFGLISLFLGTLGAGCGELDPETIDVSYDPNSAHPEMDRYIGGNLNSLRVPGIAAISIQDGEIAYEGYFGFSDMSSGEEVHADSLFYLASVSKIFVAAAVMHQVEAGSIGLEQSVAELVEFPVSHPDAPDETITMRQLLTHTSGIEDNWDIMEPLIVEGDSPVSLGTFLSGYLTPGGEYYSAANFGGAPSERFEYTNAGISLAAFAAGEAYGSDFNSLCEAEIFGPLGMASAGWSLASVDTQRLTSPHLLEDGEYEPIPHYGYPDYPDGGLRVTGRDLASFLIAHIGDDTLLAESTLDEMFRLQVPTEDADQALVWARYPETGPTVFGHDGGDDGIATVVVLDRDAGDAAILLMNGDWYADDLVEEMAGNLLRMRVP